MSSQPDRASLDSARDASIQCVCGAIAFRSQVINRKWGPNPSSTEGFIAALGEQLPWQTIEKWERAVLHLQEFIRVANHQHVSPIAIGVGVGPTAHEAAKNLANHYYHLWFLASDPRMRVHFSQTPESACERLIESVRNTPPFSHEVAIAMIHQEWARAVSKISLSPSSTPKIPEVNESSGVVQLFGRNSPARVKGKAKSLTGPQYDMIEALINARPTGLTKDSLEKVRTDGRGILTRLRKDPEWESVIHMAIVNSGRYRID